MSSQFKYVINAKIIFPLYFGLVWHFFSAKVIGHWNISDYFVNEISITSKLFGKIFK